MKLARKSPSAMTYYDFRSGSCFTCTRKGILSYPQINQIHRLLTEIEGTVAVAESCTGGLLSEFLTQLPGSSRYFVLGLVVYSNTAKQTMLGIPLSIITKKGAVSKEVAQRMAHSVRILAHTQFGIGITGIAGPGGATKDKSVGTVFIAVDTKNKKICRKFHFEGSRPEIRKKTALKALGILKSAI